MELDKTIEELMIKFLENPSSLDNCPTIKAIFTDIQTEYKLKKEQKQYNFNLENLYISSYSKEGKDKFQTLKENIYEKKINLQEKTETTLSKENINYICCQVKIYFDFKKSCPMYCSGVFIDKNHVLTLASPVIYSTPENITVFSYLEEKKDFFKYNEVTNINIPTQYMSDANDNFNYAILTLKEEIYFPDNNFCILSKNFNSLKEYDHFEYYGFKKRHKIFRSFIGAHIVDNKFKIKTIMGTGGAPLFGIKNNIYQFIGINLGINTEDKQNKCLVMNSNIIETINFVIMNENNFGDT